MFEHVFWDFDGTLFDTYPVMAGAFCKALENRGIKEDAAAVMREMKISVPHTFNVYKKKYGIDDAFIKEYMDLRDEDEKENSRPFAAAPAVCAKVVQSGKKNYLYTHKDTAALHLLEKYDMMQYFTGEVTEEDGFDRKPSPDALLYMLEKYNIPKEKAIMIGDRELDILAAKNAGVACCLLHSGIPETEATYRIEKLEELYGILGI